MSLKIKLIIVLFGCCIAGFSQTNNDGAILKVVLSKYYATQKVIVKNRFQFLSLYCKKAPNNEETFEVISKSALLKQYQNVIKSQVVNSLNEDWQTDLQVLFTNQNQYLKSKVNNCLSLEEFQKLTADHGENNQKLMIVSKPMYFGEKYCLVKVAFYRNIEHNSGCFIVLENDNLVWNIKEYLNEWST